MNHEALVVHHYGGGWCHTSQGEYPYSTADTCILYQHLDQSTSIPCILWRGCGCCVLVHGTQHVFPVRVLCLKKLFLKHYNPYTQFAPFLFSPPRITDTKKHCSLHTYYGCGVSHLWLRGVTLTGGVPLQYS